MTNMLSLTDLQDIIQFTECIIIFKIPYSLYLAPLRGGALFFSDPSEGGGELIREGGLN